MIGTTTTFLRTPRSVGFGDMKTIIVKLSSLADGGICVAATDGQRVYEEISNAVRAGNRVVISFEGVTRMTTAFLNAAVGQLYGEFDEQTVRNHLGAPESAEDWHLSRLRLVVQRAKQYFSDEERSIKAIREINGDE